MSSTRTPAAPDAATLPPLEWLRVFESAVRTGSFTGAAGELGLTQAAVSQRIRNLELHLGTTLFLRQARGVIPTTEAEAYAPHVGAALAALRRSTADLFSAPRRSLTIAATASAAQVWIIPRLPALREKLPSLQVSLVTVQRFGDLDRSGADYETRFGDGQWPNRNARRMFEEELAPVAASDLAKIDTDWRRLPQIGIAGPRDGWHDWAAAAGVAPPRPPTWRFDTFTQALAAARTGAGVLLGSLALIHGDLADGRLVRLPGPAVRMNGAYWLAWPDGTARARDHGIVVDTLCASR